MDPTTEVADPRPVPLELPGSPDGQGEDVNLQTTSAASASREPLKARWVGYTGCGAIHPPHWCSVLNLCCITLCWAHFLKKHFGLEPQLHDN